MRKELKIGLFAVLVIVISFFVLNYLRGKDIFNNEVEVKARFENVEGLVASAPVYVKGFKAGKVTDVSYDTEQNNFCVTCSVLKEFRIPKDSRMVIYSVDIMGGKGVKIDLGTSEEYVSDGQEISPAFEMGLLDGLGASVGPLVDKVSKTLDSLSVTVSGVNGVLSEDNVSSIGKSILELEQTLAQVKEVAAVINSKSGQISGFIDSLSDFSASLEGIVAKVDTTVVGVNGFVDTLNAADIEGLVLSFKALLENINDPDGTVGKLLKNDSVYNSVDSLLNNVNSLVEKIEENPKKYLKISVF